jgi:hypothetical protein
VTLRYLFPFYTLRIFLLIPLYLNIIFIHIFRKMVLSTRKNGTKGLTRWNENSYFMNIFLLNFRNLLSLMFIYFTHRSNVFLFSSRPDRLRGPSNILSMRTGLSSPRVKRPGRESDYSPPASAEVKKIWIYTATPPNAFMTQCLIS